MVSATAHSPVEIPLSNRESAREHWWGTPSIFSRGRQPATFSKETNTDAFHGYTRSPGLSLGVPIQKSTASSGTFECGHQY